MTPLEHVERIHERLKAAERAMRRLHNALQDGLEEHGELLGVPDVTVFGGGTPKPDRQ